MNRGNMMPDELIREYVYADGDAAFTMLRPRRCTKWERHGWVPVESMPGVDICHGCGQMRKKAPEGDAE